MFVLMPVLKVMEFLQVASYGMISVSCHAGRGIILVLANIWSFLRDICVVLSIIGKEFHNFLYELYATISAIANYMQSSTNSGLTDAAEVLRIFWSHMVHFGTNAKSYSLLLASGTGQCLCDTVALLYAGLILLADCSLGLITCIPKAIFSLLIWVLDGFVFSVHNLAKTLLLAINVVIHDVLKLTILVLVILLMYVMRKLLYVLILQFIWRVRHAWERAVHRLYRRRPSDDIARNSLTYLLLPLLQLKKVARRSSDPVPDGLQCVVCQENSKCVLMLPCKHMCVCQTCNLELLKQNIYSCPLCRTFVTTFITVYT